ncbi:MAG: acyltransferase, partial [Actinomycetota bacterium]|nr:acyltransferase [Actinomycetota bacterium]
VLALMVLVAHGFHLAGEGPGPGFRGENLGGWAVFGFFTISGYLITASRFANGLGTYLRHRVARIFPAFLVCLVVTAGVFAPIGWWVEHRSLSGFLTTPTTPVSFVMGNSLLRMTAYDVAGTPSGVPYPGSWNGSLWTLWFEFCCYLLVGLLVAVPLVRRRRWLLGGAFALSVLLWASLDALPGALSGNLDLQLLARLVPPFLGGAFVQTVVGRRPLRTDVAAAATAGAAALVWFVPGWGAQAAAPLVTYAILYAATVLPSPGVVRRHDISYGVYIYAFPVQQLLAYAGAYRWGLFLYDVLAAVATAVLATVSWRLVERPAIRWGRRGFGAVPTARPGHAERAPAVPATGAEPVPPGPG